MIGVRYKLALVVRRINHLHTDRSWISKGHEARGFPRCLANQVRSELKGFIMKTNVLLLLIVATAYSVAIAQDSVSLREPWEEAYSETNATGNHVIAYWSFDSQDALADNSGHGHVATLDGASINADGRFGKCLESGRGWPVDDTRHRALVKKNAKLSPKGAFTIEMWINPNSELTDYPESILIDNKYVADGGYQMVLGRADKAGLRTLKTHLGFGSMSQTWYSESLELEVGTWYHLAFVYDGKGTGTFFLNGQLVGRTHHLGLSSIAPGPHDLSIGDRVGSLYHGFPGRIDEVRICNGALEFRRVRFTVVSDRRCFRRMEANTALRFQVVNLDAQPIPRATVTWSIDDQEPQTLTTKELKPGKPQLLSLHIDSRLRPDNYDLNVALSSAGETALSIRDSFAIQIVPRHTPDRFPVVMWGAGLDEIDRLRSIGFTHALGLSIDYAKIWDAGKPVSFSSDDKVRAKRRLLDEALAKDITFAASLMPGHYLRTHNPELLRVDREGNRVTGRDDICGLFPQIPKFSYNVGVSMARTYGDLPAFGAALLESEVRDSARPCFHTHDIEALSAATGLQEVPAGINSPYGVDYKRIKDFPADRVIADDDPIYVYYRWYWKQGDGWNPLFSQLHRGLHTMKRPDFWTWHDPAVRVSSVYGSGGQADVISQWTYSYPDPIRIGLATDELFAMAGGATTQQQVMKMTQIIWYRSQTAPEPKSPDKKLAYQAGWEREQPDAPFITIPPMHLREAFWTKIARPIRGIMYHGWQSLVPCEGTAGYRLTHDETRGELARLIREVVRPLGPTLLNVPGTKSDIAFYEGFASQVYAHRGTRGWCGSWLGDAYHAAMWAGLQPEIVYDETIIERGLDPFRVIMMFDCDVVTQSVADRVNQFQARGGVIIADDRIAPAIKPDIVLTPTNRTARADKDKAALLEVAKQLRKALDQRYSRYVDSTNANVIPYRRRFADTDYIFVVNDHREYGRYVGHHGLVMENGLPSNARLSVARESGFVYDLVEHHAMETRQNGRRMVMDVHLGPCDGRVLMVTQREIHDVTIKCPDKASGGKPVTVTIAVVDSHATPIDAVVPLEVTIVDAEGREAEYSGYWAAVGGKATVQLDIAPNDPAGVWQIRVRELASEKTAVAYFRVIGAPIETDFPPLDKELANPVQPAG